MDFFFPYLNGEKANSRDSSTGLLQYSTSLSSNPFIDTVFNSPMAKTELVNRHNSSYKEFVDYTIKKGFLSMESCLEIDLTYTPTARQIAYQLLRVPSSKQSRRYLLTEYKKKIKSAEFLMNLMAQLPSRNYPPSFKKIRDLLVEDILNHLSHN